MKNEVFGLDNISNLDYKKSEDVVKDVQLIIDSSQKSAYQTVDCILLRRNWLIGKRISEEELKGEDRAKYGTELIKNLSKALMEIYKKGFTVNALYSYLRFYNTYPDIFYSVSKKSGFLSWTHYRILLQVFDDKARKWYEQEAYSQMWSVRTLQRNVYSQLFMSKYKLYLPTEEQLKAEIDNQKMLFYLQHKENEAKQ